jgi:outer membrane protein TolC
MDSDHTGKGQRHDSAKPAFAGGRARFVQAGETMKHGKATLFVLALSFALGAAGCAQKCCVQDYDQILERHGLPSDLECNPGNSQYSPPPTSAPAIVDEPDREPRYLTLHEAIAMALENGTTGIQSIRLFGTDDMDLVPANALGGLNAFGDSIRVLSLNPAIFATNIEVQLARYDAVFRSVLGINTQDQVTNTAGAIRNGAFTTAGIGLEKANVYGGLTNITFGSLPLGGNVQGNAFYSSFAQKNIINGTLNPVYTPTLTVAYAQPLLFGFGPTINSLLNNHPLSGQGGVQSQSLYSATSQPEGIVIARIFFDQQRADFERAVNFMLANVETAYWNLYGAFINLYSSEQGLRYAHTAWKINKARYEAGKIAITQYAQTREQYEQFRGDRYVALGQVLEAERVLRSLIGLRMEDGKRLVPVDAPNIAPYKPDWGSAYQECMNLRPELIMQRTDLKQKQLELIRAQNLLLPDLQVRADWNIHGAGDRLDGDSVFASGLTENALRSLASGHFQDGSIGLTLALPLGYRSQNATLRAAKLRLAQSFMQLRDQEGRAERYLSQQYRQVFEKYRVIEARHQQRLASADQLEARFKEFFAGTSTADFLVQAQRDWAAALSAEYTAIVDYNNALVRFQFAKGTLLEHNSITIAEGPLPQCAQVRAVENERQRAAAIVCRERANIVPTKPCAPDQSDCGIPQLPAVGAPTLPALQLDQKDRAPDTPLPPITAPKANAINTSTSLQVLTPPAPPSLSQLSIPPAPPSPSPVSAPALPPGLPGSMHFARPALAPGSATSIVTPSAYPVPLTPPPSPDLVPQSDDGVPGQFVGPRTSR